MQTVLRLKLTPSPEAARALEATLRGCNEQANWVSEVAFTERKFRNYDLRARCYEGVRAAGVGSQAAQHVVKKTADAYATLRANIRAGNLGKKGSRRRRKAEGKPIAFRPDAAQPYDKRNMSWNLGARTVSLWTVEGRIKDIPFRCSPEALKTLATSKVGETDLLRRDGMWFLIATITMVEPEVFEPGGFLGVDLGIVNIATTSDGMVMAGRGLNRHRERMVKLRKKLQAKNTKSAKRVLKRISRKESRRAKDINHVVSQTIVTTAERTGRGIALEDLTGIRDRVRHRKDQRYRMHSWSFHQLGKYLKYKAKRAGVPLVYVDPAYTSQACSQCGYIDRRNRRTQAEFACRACGILMHADLNGSRNIARRGQMAWDAGRQSSAPASA